MKKVVYSFVSCLLTVVVTAGAVEKPGEEEARKFIDFYYNGQEDGVVVADTKVTGKVEKNEYTTDENPEKLAVGKQYNLWNMFVVPRDLGDGKIIVQFSKNGITRITREMSVSGSIRYRSWCTFKLKYAGEWDVKMLLDKDGEITELKTMTLFAMDEMDTQGRAQIEW